jgi:mannose-1-phosphate guanylyltransferase
LAKKISFYPVILAGGRGTRFWPLSRKRRAKQLLALDGSRTMIQQTVDRLLPLAAPKNFWIITNQDLQAAIARQVPKLGRR